MNQLSYVRDVLYQLKRDYGFPIDIYQKTETKVDFITGRKLTERKKYHIHKAIVLPTVLIRKYSQILYREQKDMKYGGYYDVSARMVIIDRRDLPKTVVLTIDDYALYDQGRYEFKSVDELEHRQGYVLMIQETKGTLPREVLTASVSQLLSLSQVVGTV
jgi:hypothetical protein